MPQNKPDPAQLRRLIGALEGNGDPVLAREVDILVGSRLVRGHLGGAAPIAADELRAKWKAQLKKMLAEAEGAQAKPMDEIQFDPKFHTGTTSSGKRAGDFDDLSRLFGTVKGFQVTKIRRPRRRSSSPLNNDRKRELIKKLLVSRNLVRDVNIWDLYHCCGWTSTEIAEETGMTVGAVKRVLNRLKDTDLYP
jgi:hypothetical protein